MAEVDIIVDSYSKKNAGIKSKEGKWWDFYNDDNQGETEDMVRNLESAKVRRGDTLRLTTQDPTLFKYSGFTRISQARKAPEKTGNGDRKLDLTSDAVKKRLDEVLEFNGVQMEKCIEKARGIVETITGLNQDDMMPIALALFEKQGVQNFTALRELI
jgi:hypothetical protein